MQPIQPDPSMNPEEEKKFEGEIKQEFQLERMILFSDAVFAIVITLMAIEIHLPESEHGIGLTVDEFFSGMKHLYPVIFCYVISFGFIGMIWYQHLQIFSLLKTYDVGLVVRNLLLLLFVGLFPFAAMVISRGPKTIITPMIIYLSMIMCCLAALAFIEQYIFVTKPHLRNESDISKQFKKFQQRKLSLLMFLIIIPLTAVTYVMIPQQELKSMSTFWIMLLPIGFKIFGRKIK